MLTVLSQAQDCFPQGDEFLVVGVSVPAGSRARNGHIDEDLDVGGQTRVDHL